MDPARPAIFARGRWSNALWLPTRTRPTTWGSSFVIATHRRARIFTKHCGDPEEEWEMIHTKPPFYLSIYLTNSAFAKSPASLTFKRSFCTTSSCLFTNSSTSQLVVVYLPFKNLAAGVLSHTATAPASSGVSFAYGFQKSVAISVSTMPGWKATAVTFSFSAAV